MLEISEEVGLEGSVLSVIGLDHGSEESSDLLGPGWESDGDACNPTKTKTTRSKFNFTRVVSLSLSLSFSSRLVSSQPQLTIVLHPHMLRQGFVRRREQDSSVNERRPFDTGVLVLHLPPFVLFRHRHPDPKRRVSFDERERQEGERGENEGRTTSSSGSASGLVRSQETTKGEGKVSFDS